MAQLGNCRLVSKNADSLVQFGFSLPGKAERRLAMQVGGDGSSVTFHRVWQGQTGYSARRTEGQHRMRMGWEQAQARKPYRSRSDFWPLEPIIPARKPLDENQF